MVDLVSVIMPSYNRSHTLIRAIKSCLSQNYKNIEIIVIDDHSKDNTHDIVLSLKDERIRYFYHSENRGPAAARNTGLRNAKGTFITFLDSDDEWLNCKIDRQLMIFSSFPEFKGLVFCNGYNEESKASFISPEQPSGIVYDSRKDSFFPLRKLVSTPSGWMLPAETIKDIGYFCEDMFNWEDGDFIVKIAYKYPLYFLNEELVIWHLSDTHLNKISKNLIEGKEIFLRNNYKQMLHDKDYMFHFYRCLGKDSLSINDKIRARSFLIKALKMRPLDLSTWSKFLRTIKGI